MDTAPPDIASALRRWAQSFDLRLEAMVGELADMPPQLLEAIRHSLLAPGKRLRPYLVDRCYRLCAGGGDVFPLAAAVECLHDFTLIHDDLPAMDDADLRRGRPTSHRVYGEAMAILAGDALLALGLQLAAGSVADADRANAIVRELCLAIGGAGVIGGQVADLAGMNHPAALEQTRFIHERKTARLFQACCRVGAMAAGADQQAFKNLDQYGFHLGLAFQIADDLLDELACAETLGKHTRQDHAAGKQTYPRVFGIERSRQLGEQSVRQALEMLDAFGDDADELKQIVLFVMRRTC